MMAAFAQGRPSRPNDFSLQLVERMHDHARPLSAEESRMRRKVQPPVESIAAGEASSWSPRC